MGKKSRRIVKGVLNPATQAVRDAYFAYKKEHPESVPYEQMTPLQRRMQSGDIGVTRKQSEKVLAGIGKSRFKIPNKLKDR